MSYLKQSTKHKATSKAVKYTVGLDETTLGLFNALNTMFTKETGKKLSKSLIVRKAIQDYTGKLLTANDPEVIQKELNAIRAVK